MANLTTLPLSMYHGLTAASQDVSLTPVCIPDCRPQASFHRNMDDPILGHIRQNPSEPLKRSLLAQASQEWPHTCSGQWSICPVHYFNQWPWQNDLGSMQETLPEAAIGLAGSKENFLLVLPEADLWRNVYKSLFVLSASYDWFGLMKASKISPSWVLPHQALCNSFTRLLSLLAVTLVPVSGEPGRSLQPEHRARLTQVALQDTARSTLSIKHVQK